MLWFDRNKKSSYDKVFNNHFDSVVVMPQTILPREKQKVCSFCYRHAETRRRKGCKRCDLFYGEECDKHVK